MRYNISAEHKYSIICDCHAADFNACIILEYDTLLKANEHHQVLLASIVVASCNYLLHEETLALVIHHVVGVVCCQLRYG